MNAHPHADDLPAFALGALDAEEARLVRVHLAACPRCRATVKAYCMVVCLLPYAAPLQSPPERLKWRLLASVAGTESGEHTERRLTVSEHTNCHVEPLEKPVDPVVLQSATAVFLMVQGMGCPRCAMRVRNGLLGLEGVLMADVFLEEGMAVAAYDPARVETGDLIGAVAAAGGDGRHHYEAQVIGQAPTDSTFPQGSGGTS
jgi:copper chaperone CopZ